MIRVTLIALLAVAATSGVSAAPVPKVRKKVDREVLDGVWEPTEYQTPNLKRPMPAGTKWEFKGTSISISRGAGPSTVGTCVIDEERREVDWSYNPQTTMRGIYQIVGDELKICYSINGVRPISIFPETGQMVYTFKRSEKAK